MKEPEIFSNKMATGGVKDTDRLSDETFDILCSLCKSKKKNTEGTKFCVDCQDYYCSTCVKFHDDIPALSRHKILNKGQFQQSKGSHMVPTERCDRHSYKHVDMYCQNHDDVGCSTCMAVDHKSCKDTFFIPDFIKNNPDPVDPRAIDKNLETTADLLTDQHAKFNQEKKRLIRCEDLCLEKVKKYRKEINQRLDLLEQNSVKDIRTRYKPKLEKIDQCMDQIQKAKAKVLSAKHNLVTAGNNAPQMFVSAKKGSNITDDAEAYIVETNGEIKEQEMHFKPDSKLSTILNETNLLGQLTELGIKKDATVCLRKKETVAESSKISSKNQTTKFTSVKTAQNTSKTLIKVKEKKQYNIRIPSDKSKCNIYSACVLENGTIILADRSNSKLKQVDPSSYTVTHYCDVSSDLFQLCAISNLEVAVSCGMYKYIQFVSLRNKMVPTKQIKTNHACYGLAYAAGHLYVSHAWAVYIYTASGSQLQEFTVDHTGQNIFSSAVCLAVSDNGFKIYVADQRNELIALDKNGKVLAKFNGQELKRAESVCLTDNGHVLVCGYYSKNVVQFTHDCEMIGEIMKCDVACRSVCYDPRKSNVIIGYENKDTIDVCDVY